MFLSIIIPVYNAEKYLAECLNSCLLQDLGKNDFEIICVNDGSTDNSLHILNEYASAHANIRIINQTNSGVSIARNNGLSIASGEYVWFVDSDDFIHENFICQLKNVSDDQSPDRINFRVLEFDYTQSQDIQERMYNTGDYEGLHTSFAGVWCSIYRRSYLNSNNLSFRPMTHGEDIIFLAEFSSHENSHIFIDQVGFFYRRNPSSATSLRTDIQRKNYLESHIDGAIILEGMYRSIEHNRSSNALYLMHFLRCIMIELSKYPRSKAAPYLHKLGKYGLFPYKTPREITDKRTFMTTRTDWVGNLYNYIVQRSSTYFGFQFLRLWNTILHIKRSFINSRRST